MRKLLMHLTNAPVAVALAFLLVGAPAAPVTYGVPSSGLAYADAPPMPPPGLCNGQGPIPPECYQAILPVLLAIAGVVAFVGGLLSIIDSCRTGSCAEFFDWVEKEFAEDRRISEERLREWCKRTGDPTYLCDGVLDD